MKKRTLVVLLASAAVVHSCKKDNERSAENSLVGKWSLASSKWNEYYGGANHYDSSTYASGLFSLEFKSDGTVIESTSYTPVKDTGTYKVLNGRILLINDKDSFSIKYLSGRDLQLYFKEGPTSTGSYTEQWDNYKK